jgi:putative endonuclease
MRDKQNLGRWGETLASQFLKEKGYTIQAQNVRTPFGEIDIIARQTNPGLDAIVFIEVKTRSSASLGKPEISVGVRKQAHLLAAVQHYMQQFPEPNLDWRIDVIAIEKYCSDRPPVITHFENAVSDVQI